MPSRTSYYLVNHTLSEFCCFSNKTPLFEVIEYTFGKWPEWKKEHNICVLAEEDCKSDEINHLLNEKGYKWLDLFLTED